MSLLLPCTGSTVTGTAAVILLTAFSITAGAIPFIFFPSCGRQVHVFGNGNQLTIDFQVTLLHEFFSFRLRRTERTNYSVDQVVALCIALQLPPWLSSELLSQAGLVLRRTRQHRAYRLILDCMFMDPLDTVQSFLKASGCEELKLKAT